MGAEAKLHFLLSCQTKRAESSSHCGKSHPIFHLTGIYYTGWKNKSSGPCIRYGSAWLSLGTLSFNLACVGLRRCSLTLALAPIQVFRSCGCGQARFPMWLAGSTEGQGSGSSPTSCCGPRPAPFSVSSWLPLVAPLVRFPQTHQNPHGEVNRQ